MSDLTFKKGLSTAKPQPSVVDGQIIYHTDTSRMYIDGTTRKELNYVPQTQWGTNNQKGIVYSHPAVNCTSYTSDASAACTPLAVQKGAELFAITRPPKRSPSNPANPGNPGTCTTNNIVRWLNAAGDVQDSKIKIEDVTNTADSSKKAQVISIPTEPDPKTKKDQKMVYGYCTDQVDGTSFIGGLFPADATSYPYAEGLAIGGTTGNLLWKGKQVATVGMFLEKENPKGTGSLSLNRKANTDIGTNSVALGDAATASGNNSFAEGYKTTASGPASHAEGSNTTASGQQSHAEGAYAKASGNYSHAENYGTNASEYASHAEGYGTTASSSYSHAEGNTTTASGQASHAEGSSTTAFGTNSHAEGDGTTAEGEASHAEGAVTIASGIVSHAEGQASQATGDVSHAEGIMSVASGGCSHAEGYYTAAHGNYSHAEGASTVALGDNSHAEGYNTLAFGINSHAEGEGTIAKGLNQHVQGTYNIPIDDYTTIHIVGNGTDNNTRSNAHIINDVGDAWFAGNVYVGSTSGTDWDDGCKQLATTADLANYLPINGNASSASKLGSDTIGSSTTPIYLNAGTPEACGFKIMVADDLPDESPNYNGTICIIY